MTKLACLMCILGFAALGGYVGQSIRAKAYPLEVFDRHNLTPVVEPGTPVQLAQHVVRHDQCYLLVKRTITTSSGQRFTVNQPFEEGFGPVGGDRYILPIPTDESATHGRAKMYSRGFSWCSLLDTLLGWSSSDPWEMDFEFGPQTQVVEPPSSFAGVGVKLPAKPATSGAVAPRSDYERDK